MRNSSPDRERRRHFSKSSLIGSSTKTSFTPFFSAKSETLAAIGAKYGKSAAQVALRWLAQRGIVAIPKSSHKERMAQNFNIFDFALTADEMTQIATMNQHDTGTVNFGDPQFVKYLIETYG